MDTSLNTALAQSNIEVILLAAVVHADNAMRRYVWRGFKPKVGPGKQLVVDGKSADDFVQEALAKLCDGTRKYDASRSLLENLNSVVDSLISSAKKSSDRKGLVDHGSELGHENVSVDPVSTAPAATPTAEEHVLSDEILMAQRECFKLVKASFDGDKETQEYLEALSEGYFDVSEIETLTGIPAARIYEIRRKLKNYVPGFFGVENYQELNQKIKEGRQ